MNLKEKFEILAKSSGWNDKISSSFDFNLSSALENENISKLIDHVMLVLERREITCVELNRSFERQQLELEASKEQNNLTSSRLKELREKLNASENYGIELNSRISSLTAQILSIEQNLKREKSQANWSAEELQNTLNAFSNFRKEQSVLIGEIRSQAEVANFQAQEAQQKLFRTLQSLKNREKQISELQEQIAVLKADLSANETNFTREMNSNARMIELYRNASDEATEKISILQNEIEELRDLLASSEAQESCNAADLKAELEDHQEIIKSKEEQLEKMKIALDGLLKVAKVSQEDTSVTRSDINVSNDQLCTDYVICKGRLAKAEEECYQMRSSMQKMMNEINIRESQYGTIKNENSRLQDDINTLTEQLIEASQARDIAISERMEFERVLASLLLEKDTIQQECNDLSQQVQRLLFEIENNSNNQKQGASFKRHRPSSEVLQASEIITENFVDLTSIAQLQQRNQELLKSLRVISAKYEALEKVKESPQLKTQLEAALKELDEMNEARKRQTQMVETILKTKTSGSIEHESKVFASETLNMELEHLKKQLESRQETLKQIISEFDENKKQLADERVSKARVVAQLEMSEERLKMIQETLQQERLEAVSIRERINSQMDNLNLAQSSTNKLMADLSNSQDRETRLHGQVEKLQSEINALMIENARLQQESLSALGERDRYVGMLGSMQSLLSEHEASEATLKRHFTAQIEYMERESEASRTRLSEISSAHAATLSAVERDRAELFKRLEVLSEELTQRKEVNLRLEANLTQAQEKINDLERVLNQAASESAHDETNVKTFELRIRSLTVELKNQQTALQAATLRAIELEEQVKELEELKSQLNSEKEALSAKDRNLQESLIEIEHMKGDKERLEEELVILREQSQISQNRVTQLSAELEDLREQFSSKLTEISLAEEERNRLSSQLNNFKTRCVELDSELIVKNSEQNHLKSLIQDLESRQKDLQKQNEVLLDEAQKNVGSSKIDSDELGGGADLGVIRFLREEKDKLRSDRDRLLSEVRNFQLQAEEAKLALNSERLALSSQSDDYARLLAEVERLNSVRESGALQQQELSQLKMKVSMLETQLKAKIAEIAPIKDTLEKVNGENEELKESQLALKSDRDSWKIRFETAISTASDTSPIESELKQVKLQSEMFRQRAIALTKNLAETRTAAQREIKELQIEIEELKNKIGSAPVENIDNKEIEMSVINADIEMSHAESFEPEIPVANMNAISGLAKTTEIASTTSIEKLNHQDFDNVKESNEVQSEEADEESEEDEEEDDDDKDSIYKESDVIESISEAVSVSESPLIEAQPVEPSKGTETLFENGPPVIIAAAPVVEQPILVSEQLQSQPITNEVPRKKIVSLSRIVGNSSVSTASMTSIVPNTPAMITTASGKKFVPVTFPDPPSTSVVSSQPNTSTNSNLSGTSPSRLRKTKKNKKSKKNKSSNNSNINMSD